MSPAFPAPVSCAAVLRNDQAGCRLENFARTVTGARLKLLARDRALVRRVGDAGQIVGGIDDFDGVERLHALRKRRRHAERASQHGEAIDCGQRPAFGMRGHD